MLDKVNTRNIYMQKSQQQISSEFNALPIVSAELFIIPLEEAKFLIYAPTRESAFVTNARTVNFLADLQSGQLDVHANIETELVEFLRRLKILDAGVEILPITTIEGIPAQTSVTLFLTTACNLRCTYCYAAAGDTSTKIMTLETAKYGIDFVVKNALQNKMPGFEVNFHGGGEPTVNWQTLTGAIDYARKIASKFDLNLAAYSATNGLLSKYKIDWILSNLQGASISFDGLPSVHDKHRRTPSGKGSSERVINTLLRFDEAGFPYGLRVTVTADHSYAPILVRNTYKSNLSIR